MRECLEGEFFEVTPAVKCFRISVKKSRHDYYGSIIIAIQPK